MANAITYPWTPRRVFPVDNGLVSVSVVSKSSIDADALSTSLFVLGIEKAMEFLRQFPDTYAVFIDKDNRFTEPRSRESIYVARQELSACREMRPAGACDVPVKLRALPVSA
jgi:hypothetical protein